MNKPVIGIICAVLVVAIGSALMMKSSAAAVSDDVSISLSAVAFDTLGADVSVDPARVPFFGGPVTIDTITVSSPAGFSPSEAIALRNVTIDLDRGSLKSDVVKVNKVTVGEMTIMAEYKLVGASNLSALLQNARTYSGAATARKLSIAEVVLPTAQMTVITNVPGSKPIALEVPAQIIDRRNKAQASTGNEVVTALFSDTYSHIDAVVKDANLFQQVKRDSVDTAKKVGKAIGHFFKNTAGNVKDAIDRNKNEAEQPAPDQK
jgi:hypothetical protein